MIKPLILAGALSTALNLGSPEVELFVYDQANEYCQNKGIMTGYEDGLFHSEDVLTRGMLATMLYRLSGSPAIDPNDRGFEDVPEWSFYKTASTWLKSQKIMTGNYQQTFDGQEPIKRQDLALVMWRLFNKPFANHSLYNDLPREHYANKAVDWAISQDVIRAIEYSFKGSQPAVRGMGARAVQRHDELAADSRAYGTSSETFVQWFIANAKYNDPAIGQFNMIALQSDGRSFISAVNPFDYIDYEGYTFLQFQSAQAKNEALKILKQRPDVYNIQS